MFGNRLFSDLTDFYKLFELTLKFLKLEFRLFSRLLKSLFLYKFLLSNSL